MADPNTNSSSVPEQEVCAQDGNRRIYQLVALPEKLMWTIGEAALMCGISESYYRKLRNNGVLPGPISDTNRYSANAVRKALSANTKEINDSESAYDDWRGARG